MSLQLENLAAPTCREGLQDVQQNRDPEHQTTTPTHPSLMSQTFNKCLNPVKNEAFIFLLVFFLTFPHLLCPMVTLFCLSLTSPSADSITIVQVT